MLLVRNGFRLPAVVSWFSGAVLFCSLAGVAFAAMGRTEGSFGVSPDGSAQYSIPLTLPPGVNGLTPQLSLTYSSTAGNSITGLGWMVQGLPAISRCNFTKAQDGGTAAASLVISDPYCLGGSRLRLTSAAGTYGQLNSTYQTEIESFLRATVTAANASGPTAWEVRTRDGLIHEYGNTTDSRIESVNSAAVRLWALNKIRDRAGNYIEFIYEKDTTGGGYRPLEILYGRNAPHTGVHTTKVAFVYEAATRPDPIYSFRFGKKGTSIAGPIHEFKRLDRINVIDLLTTTTVRTYELSYDPVGGAGNRSRLITIQEFRGADSLLPTSVQWTSGTSGWGSETSTSTAVPAGFLRADINGDKRQDIVYSSSTTSGAGTWWYMLATPTGFAAAVNTSIGNHNYSSAQIIEWNGDDMWDILVPCNGTNTWCVLQANGTGFAPSFNTGTSSTGVQLAADVSCDGRDDLVRIDTAANPDRIYTRVRGASGFAATETLAWTSPLTFDTLGNFAHMATIRARTRHRRVDFNGDGCEDFVVPRLENDPEPGIPDLHWIAAYFGTPTTMQDSVPIGSGSTPVGVVLVGDFNGDGLTDLAHTQGSAYSMRMGSGSAFSGAVAGPSTTGYITGSAFIADHDGDGLEDVVMMQSASFNWFVSRSTGNGFAALSTLGFGGAAMSPMDFGGDKLTDMVRVDSTASNAFKYRAHNGSFPDLVDRVTDGYTNYVDFDYVPLSNAGATYTKGAAPTYPVVEFQGALYVVSRYVSPTGTGSTYEMTFNYDAARLHVDGRGFLGFRKRTAIDSRNNVRTEETYVQDPLEYQALGAHDLVEVRQGSGKLISSVDTTWNKLTYNPGTNSERRFPYPQSVVRSAYGVSTDAAYNEIKLNTETTTVASVDAASGLISDSTTTNFEETTAAGARPNATYTYRTQHSLITSDMTSWCVGRPGWTQQTNSHNQWGGTIITRTTGRTWDSTACRATREVEEPAHATLEVATDIGYDNFGNVSSLTVTGKNPNGTGMAPRLTQFDWGTNGRFLRKVTNALSQETNITWDEDIGTKATVVDANGLVTAWDYDNFGRLTREDRPDSTATTISYSDCATLGCINALNKTTVVRTELDTADVYVNEVRTYRDHFDRPIASSTRVFSGNFDRRERQYDALGRVAQEAAPCLWSSCASPFWTTYTYDVANRVTQISRPISETNTTLQTTNFYYEGLRTRIRDAELKETRRIAAVTGDLARLIGHDNYYQEHDYDSFGNLVRVFDNAVPSNDLSFSIYTIRGVRTSVYNPNAGTVTFTPNSLGEVMSLVDQMSQTKTFTYDALGRMTSRTETEGLTEWTWGANAGAKNIGRLESVESPGGIGEFYAFDSVGRLNQTTHNLSGDGTHVFEYGYNNLGTLSTLFYPTSTPGNRLKIQYDYTSNGHLQRVKDLDTPATVFWQVNQASLRGQVTNESLGHGVITTRSFDAVTGAVNFIRSGSGDVSGVQNLSYLWDRVGNLVQRQDGNLGVTEDFTYDNLHRLDTVKLNNTLTMNVDYDTIGNISSRSDVAGGAAWTYHSTQKNAVTSAGTGGATFTYNANGNAITRNGSAIAWTSFNLPREIDHAGGHYADFWYDGNHKRYKQVGTAVSGGITVTRTTLYVGELFEKITDDGAAGTYVAYRNRILAGGREVAVHYRDSSSGRDFYLYHDHQNSLFGMGATLALGGALFGDFSNDAYGKRRDEDWSGAPDTADLAHAWSISSRAYTGHEHLDNVGLIHMNGRVYDPSVGRFLSADPFVDGALATQGFNRYGYVGNRPLTFIDPSGFTVDDFRIPLYWWWDSFLRNTEQPYRFRDVPVINPNYASPQPKDDPDCDPTVDASCTDGSDVATESEDRCWNGQEGGWGDLADGLARQVGNDLSELAAIGMLMHNPLAAIVGPGMPENPFGSNATNKGILGADMAPAAEVAVGGIAGAARSLMFRGMSGLEFSHWIPARFGGPRSIFNGNFVSSARHYLHDPFRFPPGWRQLGDKWPAPLQQLDRVPNPIVGGALGGALPNAEAGGCR